MKIMVFVVDDLPIENLSEVYVKWNEMYLLSRSENFKESDLENFQVKIIIQRILDRLIYINKILIYLII